MGKRELIALLNLSSWCFAMVEQLFLVVPLGCLRFVIVVYPDHTHLLFFGCLSGPPVKYFTDHSKAVHLLWICYVFSVLCLLCLCERLFICALWSPAEKPLGSRLWCPTVSLSHFIGILGQV